MYVHTIVVLPHNLSELTSVGHIIESLYFYAIVFFTTYIYEKTNFYSIKVAEVVKICQ